MVEDLAQKAKSRELTLLLEAIGAERCTSILRWNTYSLQNVDYILCLAPTVPQPLYLTARAEKKPIVTGQWLTQCIIMNDRIDFDMMPEFQYSHNS